MKTNLLMLVFSLLAGALAGWLSAAVVHRSALERTELLTPVVVLDATSALQSLSVQSSPQEIAAVMEKVRDQAERLKAKGFLVLKPNAVMAVPEGVYVRVDTP